MVSVSVTLTSLSDIDWSVVCCTELKIQLCMKLLPTLFAEKSSFIYVDSKEVTDCMF